MKRLISCCLLISSLIAEPRYGISVDIDMSPYASAEDLIFADRFLVYGADYLKFGSRSVGVAGSFLRAAEWIFIWYPIERFTMVAQHEVFGHGYRIRNLGSTFATVAGYQIDAPPPYGPGGGATGYFTTDRLTADQTMAIDVAGIEATAIMAGELKKKWLDEGCIDGRMASLYLECQHDSTEYMWNAYSRNDSQSGHDINAYLYWLNTTYPSGNLTPRGINGMAYYNLIDPMTYYAIWAELEYFITGEKTPIPTINIDNWKLLPNMRIGLSPFCPEFYFELFAKHCGRIHYTYFRTGRFGNNSTLGLGWECKRLAHYRMIDWGLRFDGWVQPGYSTYSVDQHTNGVLPQLAREPSVTGVNCWLVGSICVLNPVDVEVTAGWKTTGFMQGEPLTAGPILRLSILGRF